MGGGSKLPQSALLARPELASILQYHILPGLYTGGEQGERRRMGGGQGDVLLRGGCCCGSVRRRRSGRLCDVALALKPSVLPCPALFLTSIPQTHHNTTNTTTPPPPPTKTNKTAYLRNNTPVYSAKGVEVVPFVDGCQTGGKILLHDSCIDKPTPDSFTCAEQKAFDKCSFPFMSSALSAQWQGGFCQRTCQRCSCAPDSGAGCAAVTLLDAPASNGVVHAVSRVLFPPPLFTKEAAIAEAAAYNASVGAGGALPGAAAAAPGALPGALPGAAPGALPTVAAAPPAAAEPASLAPTDAAAGAPAAAAAPAAPASPAAPAAPAAGESPAPAPAADAAAPASSPAAAEATPAAAPAPAGADAANATPQQQQVGRRRRMML